METENYYIRNEETGKLNVFTNKAYYAALEIEQKKIFTHYCLWSNKQQCWVSKGKAENCGYLKGQLLELQFTDKGSVGKSLPFEEQVAKEQQNAAIKAEHSDARAAKAELRSDELYNHAKDMASVIPFGQPILMRPPERIGQYCVIQDIRTDKLWVAFEDEKIGCFNPDELLILRPKREILQSIVSSNENLSRDDYKVLMNILQLETEKNPIRALQLAMSNESYRNHCTINCQQWEIMRDAQRLKKFKQNRKGI